MGAQNEQHPAHSGGNRAKRLDLPVTSTPATEQLTFFTEAEETIPSAFSFSKEEISHLLRMGGNTCLLYTSPLRPVRPDPGRFLQTFPNPDHRTAGKFLSNLVGLAPAHPGGKAAAHQPGGFHPGKRRHGPADRPSGSHRNDRGKYRGQLRLLSLIHICIDFKQLKKDNNLENIDGIDLEKRVFDPEPRLKELKKERAERENKKQEEEQAASSAPASKPEPEEPEDSFDDTPLAVSYTHLDVYKRQGLRRPGQCGQLRLRSSSHRGLLHQGADHLSWLYP